MSIYYQDEDANVVETQVDVFSSIDETNTYLESDDFQTNPIRVDFDLDEIVEKLAGGASWEELSQRAPSPPRHPATMPRAYLGSFHWALLQMLQLVQKLGSGRKTP